MTSLEKNMEEKEIKIILNIGLDEFIGQVLQAGFVTGKTIKQQDIYFDNEEWRLYRNAACLRARFDGNGARQSLDFKKLFYFPKTGWYVDEQGYSWPPRDIILLFPRLGYHKIADIKKTRQAFCKADAEVCLDDIEGISPIVEIECQRQDPAILVNSLLKPSEWERTVEGTSNLFLRIKRGMTEHLSFPDRFKADPDWNVWPNERDWYECVKGESVGA